MADVSLASSKSTLCLRRTDVWCVDVAANWDVDELLVRKEEIAKSDMFKFRMVV